MNLKLSELKPVYLQEFYNKRLADGIKAVTVIHYHANIHKALKYAVKMDLILYNTSYKVEHPQKVMITGSFYSEDEVHRLFETFKGDECELCIHIAAFYGLRRNEVIGLKWSVLILITRP